MSESDFFRATIRTESETGLTGVTGSVARRGRRGRRDSIDIYSHTFKSERKVQCKILLN